MTLENVSDDIGTPKLRVIAVWNQAYNRKVVLATDHAEALTLCYKKKFMRRLSQYRKYEDMTDAVTTSDPGVLSLIEAGEPGVLIEGTDGKWTLEA